jgi:hypothetical protein
MQTSPGTPSASHKVGTDGGVEFPRDIAVRCEIVYSTPGSVVNYLSTDQIFPLWGILHLMSLSSSYLNIYTEEKLGNIRSQSRLRVHTPLNFKTNEPVFKRLGTNLILLFPKFINIPFQSSLITTWRMHELVRWKRPGMTFTIITKVIIVMNFIFRLFTIYFMMPSVTQIYRP